MSLIASVTFTHISNSSDYYEIEKEVFEEKKKWKNKICKAENISIGDLYWTSLEVSKEERITTVTLCGCRISEYRNKSADELSDMLAEIKEELEELTEELEEIEDLDEDDYDDYDFESKEEYKERLDELEVDIFIHETEIELIEKVMKGRCE